MSITTTMLPDKALEPYVALDQARFNAYCAKYDSYVLSRICRHPEIAGNSVQAITTFLKEIAIHNGINPWALIVYGQREQGTFSRSRAVAGKMATTPKTWKEDGLERTGTLLEYAERFALGFGAYESGFTARFAGFETQFVEVGKFFRRKLNEYAASPTTVKAPMTIDGQMVVPETRFTRIQLRYTPHMTSLADTRNLFQQFAPELLA